MNFSGYRNKASKLHTPAFRVYGRSSGVRVKGLRGICLLFVRQDAARTNEHGGHCYSESSHGALTATEFDSFRVWGYGFMSIGNTGKPSTNLNPEPLPKPQHLKLFQQLLSLLSSNPCLQTFAGVFGVRVAYIRALILNRVFKGACYGILI